MKPAARNRRLPAAMFSRSRSGRAGRGFTLLEILLAVALAAMLLVAVNFFVLSMGELWGGGSEERLFDRHVRGVTRFVDALVQQSVELPEATTPERARSSTGALNPAPRGAVVAAVAGPDRFAPAETYAAALRRLGVRLAGQVARRQWAGEVLALAGFVTRIQGTPRDTGGRGRLPRPVREADAEHPPPGGGSPIPVPTTTAAPEGSGVRFRFGTPAGYEGGSPMLMFEVDEAPGQCVWPHRPLPQVECALQVNADEGLVLLWKSKLEEDYGSGRPRKTQLSPFGRGVSFEYYDAERKAWSHSAQPQADGNGGWRVPQRVRLAFAYRGYEREVAITLPEAPGGAPLR